VSELVGAALPVQILRAEEAWSSAESAEALYLGESRLLSAAPFDGEHVTTFPPNWLPLTGFFDAGIFEVCRNNLGALVLGATGDKHTADLTVSAGHKHDGLYSRLRWRQIASFPFVNNGQAVASVGAAPDECYDALVLNSATTQVLAQCRFWGARIDVERIIPRLRVSNDNSATNTVTLTLDFYEPDLSTLVASMTIVFDTSVVRARQWIDGAVVDLTAASADADVSDRRPLIVRLSGIQSAATEPVAIHELAFGVQA
jgi:hypothetical protein